MSGDLRSSTLIEHPIWTERLSEADAFCGRILSRAAAMEECCGHVALLLTGDDALSALNREFRGKSGPTNVLSFPAPPGMVQPGEEALPHLGDLALSGQTLAREAEQACRDFAAHTCHLIVHGFLHLLGYDHIDDESEARMQAREIAILAELGFANPYQED